MKAVPSWLRENSHFMSAIDIIRKGASDGKLLTYIFLFVCLWGSLFADQLVSHVLPTVTRVQC